MRLQSHSLLRVFAVCSPQSAVHSYDPIVSNKYVKQSASAPVAATKSANASSLLRHAASGAEFCPYHYDPAFIQIELNATQQGLVGISPTVMAPSIGNPGRAEQAVEIY
ncbi:hypothetical protein V6N12_070929 [Hibiscus sabdariffa]|uniref:Uncharacterized protein n=1 Tax=Hibiscus sabdariffa TaxID=183260 RepID=A0ABR2FIK3_9ROSI